MTIYVVLEVQRYTNSFVTICRTLESAQAIVEELSQDGSEYIIEDWDESEFN